MRLIDRREKMVLNGSEYELTLLWNRENIRRCCFGMCPDYAYILVKPEWKVVVHSDDINTIPFKALLAKLPNL